MKLVIEIPTINVNLHIQPDHEVRARLDAILNALGLILHKEDIIMSMETDALDQAEAAAAANSAADDSAEQLLLTLSAMIADLKNHTSDPQVAARITALATAINDRAAKLGAAVVANTQP